jgi:hypothetical protein
MLKDGKEFTFKSHHSGTKQGIMELRKVKIPKMRLNA